MKRFVPFLIFVLITGGLVAFIYQDRLFPKSPEEAGQRAAAQENSGGGGGRRRGGGQRRAGETVPVLAEAARTENVPVYLMGVGTVQAYNTATVRAQVSGRLIDVTFSEGQNVKKGDVLAKIDPVLYKAALDQAIARLALDQAQLDNARRDAQRFMTLAKSDYASQQQADTAKAQVAQFEAQVRQDQAAIDTAQANLDYATVRAPIDGRTGLRLLDTGNLVSSSDATGIVVITQLQPISVVFTLPENTVSSILEAQRKTPLALQGVVGSEVIAEGTLEVIDNQIDQATGTVKLKGTFPNKDFRLWPGQYLTVKLRLKTLENAVVVPTGAVQQGASGAYVFAAGEDNTAKLIPVKVVQEAERVSVIGEGVTVGMPIVTSGFASLQDGTKIRVDNPGAKADGLPGRKPTDGGPEKPRHRRRESAASGESSGGDRTSQATQETQGQSSAPVQQRNQPANSQ